MSKFVQLVVILGLSCFICQSVLALPAPDEERYLEKEYNRDLMNWLTSSQYPQQWNNLCRYYVGNLLTAPMPKRNSELINSLLSLPKNMNDAGK